MDNFTPTPEQIEIVNHIKFTPENLLVDALAGAAKTSSLVLIAKAKPDIPILSLAFNKKIAEEMGKRLPSNCTSKTMNSVGHGAWASQLGKRLVLESDKTHNLFKQLIDESPKRMREDLWANSADIRSTVNAAKVQGYIPKQFHDRGRSLITQEDFYASLEEEPSDLVIDSVEQILTWSITQAYQGLINFDDQIYMPTLFGGTWPKFPLNLGDEVQDWSPINHVMLGKIVGDRRLAAVGDPNQSIYGIRGAMTSGMEALAQTFNMKRLTLSISFRCPRAVVRNAHWRAAHMKYPDWAIEGEVRRLEQLSVRDVPDGAVFICRNNAPLFSVALEFLKAGRGVKILGSDIGPGLKKVLQNLGPTDLLQEAALSALAKWKAEKERKSRSAGALNDRYECLKFFIEQAPNLGGAIAYADHLFSANGPVQFSSGHKSKGLEWDTVYHLDPWRVPSKWAFRPEAIEQEHNLKYVIETRAKKSLFLIDAESIIYDTKRTGNDELA